MLIKRTIRYKKTLPFEIDLSIFRISKLIFLAHLSELRRFRRTTTKRVGEITQYRSELVSKDMFIAFRYRYVASYLFLKFFISSSLNIYSLSSFMHRYLYLFISRLDTILRFQTLLCHVKADFYFQATAKEG